MQLELIVKVIKKACLKNDFHLKFKDNHQFFPIISMGLKNNLIVSIVVTIF